MSELFDRYSLQARMAPALLSLFPLFLLIAISFPQLYTVVAGLFSLALACGILTLAAHFARSRGKALEKRLNERWGGRPTTLFLLNNNNELDSQTYQRYVQFFTSNIPGWSLGHDPVPSYESAVRWLLERTRDTGRFNLVFNENISYGFRRNCLGMKPIGLIVAMVCSIVWVVEIYSLGPQWSAVQPQQWAGLGFTVLLFTWWIIIVGESWVRESGDAYAKALLGSIDTMV
ncbi:MAG: hypothetical protein F4X97_09795 [Boseongicola sp. SB0662_bin_57]|nr:hypothetical protein [Boseongicola sp. SB0662_bin_57]